MGTGKGLRFVNNKPLAAVAFVAVVILAATGAGQAATPYGGSFTPPTTASPAGFQSAVQTATTIRVSGGRLTAPVVRGAVVTVRVPAHAFKTPVQVAITQPSLSGLRSLLPRLGYTRYSVATGFGIVISRPNGAIMKGTFAKPVTVEVRGSRMGEKGEKVLSVASLTSTTALRPKRSSRKVAFSIRRSSNLIVANPVPSSSSNT